MLDWNRLNFSHVILKQLSCSADRARHAGHSAYSYCSRGCQVRTAGLRTSQPYRWSLIWSLPTYFIRIRCVLISKLFNLCVDLFALILKCGIDLSVTLGLLFCAMLKEETLIQQEATVCKEWCFSRACNYHFTSCSPLTWICFLPHRFWDILQFTIFAYYWW